MKETYPSCRREGAIDIEEADGVLDRSLVEGGNDRSCCGCHTVSGELCSVCGMGELEGDQAKDVGVR